MAKACMELRGLKLTLAAKHAPGPLHLLAAVCLASISITYISTSLLCSVHSRQGKQQPSEIAELMWGRL